MPVINLTALKQRIEKEDTLKSISLRLSENELENLRQAQTVLTSNLKRRKLVSQREVIDILITEFLKENKCQTK